MNLRIEMTSRLSAVVLFLLSISVVYAASENKNEYFKLWEHPAPGALGTQEKDIASLTAYLPADRRTDVGVIICPGGGYSKLAIDHEGCQIAEWFNSRGVAAFVLKYRLPANGYKHPIPLLDAQRAIKFVRSKASDWRIYPSKIGILGFSAGGHLASSTGTHFQTPILLPGQLTDNTDSLSCRPDFMILVYPVISMREGITHKGSRTNLLGNDPSQELVDLMSNETQITSATPPTFLVHAGDDKAVPVKNSILFYEGLQKANVASELHVFLKGGHGFGMRPEAGPASGWADLSVKWLEQLGLLKNEKAD